MPSLPSDPPIEPFLVWPQNVEEVWWVGGLADGIAKCSFSLCLSKGLTLTRSLPVCEPLHWHGPPEGGVCSVLRTRSDSCMRALSRAAPRTESRCFWQLGKNWSGNPPGRGLGKISESRDREKALLVNPLAKDKLIPSVYSQFPVHFSYISVSM